MSERVLMAMSGGVDSSLAAALLVEAGYDVVGLFMNFFSGTRRRAGSRSCCAVEDATDARRVAARLEIPFYSADMHEQFAGITSNFVSEYQQGRTPIPCTLCNRDVKFGSLLDTALRMGASYVATGHYARLGDRGERGGRSLLRARDQEKDQTYFLWALSAEARERALFPLGEMDKSEVRAQARARGLVTADKPESQDLCFVPDGDYASYLREVVGITTRPGPIVDTAGRVVGAHGGIENFTIGQRRGLEVALGTPRYVVALDPESATVTIGTREELDCHGLEASGAIYGAAGPPAAPLTVDVRIRHTRATHVADLEALPGERFRLRFHSPVSGVTPGQAAVAYQGDEVIAGGWIDRSLGA